MMNYNNELNLFIAEFSEKNEDDLAKQMDSKDFGYKVTQYPVLYILKSDTKVYVGQTTSILTRMHSHLQNEEKK